MTAPPSPGFRSRPTTPTGDSSSRCVDAEEPHRLSVETGTDGVVTFALVGICAPALRRHARRLAAHRVRRRICSCPCATASPASRAAPTAAGATCSTPSRVPTSARAPTTTRSCSTSTSPTTRRAPTTRRGSARSRSRATPSRRRSRSASSTRVGEDPEGRTPRASFPAGRKMGLTLVRPERTGEPPLHP